MKRCISKTSAAGFALLWCISCAHADSGQAAPDASTEWAFKLTPSYYATTHEHVATDLNLRANYGPHAVWLGQYQRGNEFEQTRTGYEYTANFSIVQLVPSLQLATHGFAGGSLNAQIGTSIYGLLGFGRTNTKDYYNLNFDPNDSIIYGFGTSLLPNSAVSLFTVKDNRLHTGQVVTHLVWRLTPDEKQRWTVDLSSKHGRASENEDSVAGKSISLTYDYRNLFGRYAYDQKCNFTNENQTRFSLGVRF